VCVCVCVFVCACVRVCVCVCVCVSLCLCVLLQGAGSARRNRDAITVHAISLCSSRASPRCPVIYFCPDALDRHRAQRMRLMSVWSSVYARVQVCAWTDISTLTRTPGSRQMHTYTRLLTYKHTACRLVFLSAPILGVQPPLRSNSIRSRNPRGWRHHNNSITYTCWWTGTARACMQMIEPDRRGVAGREGGNRGER